MDELVIHTAWTEQDIKKGAFYNIIVRRPVLQILCLLLFLGGLFCLIFSDIMRLHYIFAIIFMVYPFVLLFLQFRQIKRVVARRKDWLGQPQVITISDESITLRSDIENQDLDWGNIRAVRELSDQFLCYTTVNRLIYLPKRDFSAEQINAFRGMVINHLSYKNSTLK